MQLTIHGVERLQERTLLSLNQLRQIALKEAYVDLGYDFDQEARFLLFYDYLKKSFRILCIRDGVLVTILKTYYSLPAGIRRAISGKSKGLARALVHEHILETPVVDLHDVPVTLSICKGNSWLLVPERLGEIPLAKLSSLSRAEILEEYVSDIVQRSSHLQWYLPGKYAFKVEIYNQFGQRAFRFSFSPKEIVKAYLADQQEPLLKSTLTVEDFHAHDRFDVDAGTLPLASAKDFESAVEQCGEIFTKIFTTLENRLLLRRMNVQYRFFIQEPESGIPYAIFSKYHSDITH